MPSENETRDEARELAHKLMWRAAQQCGFQHTAMCDEVTTTLREALELRCAVPFADAEALARRFHETYERLAPSFGYETRKASAKPWADVPENNRRLMIAVAGEIISEPSQLQRDLDALTAERDALRAEVAALREEVETARFALKECIRFKTATPSPSTPDPVEAMPWNESALIGTNYYWPPHPGAPCPPGRPGATRTTNAGTPPTFAQLVDRVGPLPTTGLASAEAPPCTSTACEYHDRGPHCHPPEPEWGEPSGNAHAFECNWVRRHGAHTLDRHCEADCICAVCKERLEHHTAQAASLDKPVDGPRTYVAGASRVIDLTKPASPSTTAERGHSIRDSVNTIITNPSR